MEKLGSIKTAGITVVFCIAAATAACTQTSYSPSSPAHKSLVGKSPEGNSSTGLSALPVDAQGPISGALGQDYSGYWLHPTSGGSGADGFRGENPRQALAVEFTKQGAEVRSHNLRWALETRAYGYGNAMRPVKAVAPQAKANRVEYRRDGVTEWYENGPLGLEQGFTLARRPGQANGQALTLELELHGGLAATLEPAGLNKKSKALELRGKDGKAALRYTGLEARDATGRELPSWLELRGERLLVRVEDKGARYPVVVDPWFQQAELTASDGAANDDFGYSVALSGSTAIVSAPQHSSAQGAAYVFVQSGTTWTQQAELMASDGAAGDQFGSFVALNGKTAVIAAFQQTVGSNAQQGAAYVFVQSGTTWTQQAELTASDGAAGDSLGLSAAISGATIVLGAPFHTVGSNAQQGAAYVFVQSGTTWTQQAELTASDGAAGDSLGVSVAVSGSRAVAGAPLRTVGSNAQQGAAYAFLRNGTTWTQQAELTASDGAAGDGLGYSAAISGATIVLGAPFHTVGSTAQQGAAYVFVQSGTTWTQQAELTASDGGADDELGLSSAGLSGSMAVVGAYSHTVGSNPGQGAAYLFAESGGTWTQQAELTSSDGLSNDGFGLSVAISGGTVVVGGNNHTVGSNSAQGAAYVFVPGTTVTLTPGALSFGDEAVNTTSLARTVMLKNTGPATLDISNIAITSGTNFTISNNTCGSTLAVNRVCRVSVTFTASQFGAATATLGFTDNVTGSPQTVALSGTGVEQATLTPIDISFPTTKVGRTTTQNVILKNNLPTMLTGISYSITGPFGLSPLTTCGTTLDSKKSCIFQVTFSPTATGPASGTLTVTDSANDSPQTVIMEGDGD